MLISRLYLNLRTFQDKESKSLSTRAPGTLRFASNRILGNIGAPMNSFDKPGQEYHFEEETDEGHGIGGSRADLDDLGRGLTIDGGVAQDMPLIPVVRSSLI